MCHKLIHFSIKKYYLYFYYNISIHIFIKNDFILIFLQNPNIKLFCKITEIYLSNKFFVRKKNQETVLFLFLFF